MKWAAILAGGNGTRIQALTRALTGDDRPKQFCPLLNGQTLLATTRQRVALNVLPSRTLCVVTRSHQPYYRPELAYVPPARMIEQPGNLGTAAAVAYSVARVRQEDRKAIIGIFPVDHHFDDVLGFSHAVALTYRAALRHPDVVFLLGAEPSGANADYGWIEPGPPLFEASEHMFAVRRFWEKPSPDVALDLFDRGCLWNMFVMIGGVGAFRTLLYSTVPDLARAFESIEDHADQEADAAARIYASQRPADFSRDVLAKHPNHAAVVRLPDVGWTDLGEPTRIQAFLGRQAASFSPAPGGSLH